MIKIFTNFKFTNGIFFKKLDHRATLEKQGDKFIISIFNNFFYCGNYHIISFSKKVGVTIYRTAKELSNEISKTEAIPGINEFFIHIPDTGNRVIICDSELKGIILK